MLHGRLLCFGDASSAMFTYRPFTHEVSQEGIWLDMSYCS